MRHLGRIIGLVLVVCTCIVPAASGSSGPPLGPAGLAFYTAPSVMPARAGDVIRYRPTTFYQAPLTASTARAWKVLYRSTTARGGAVAVSGLVLVPRKAWSGPGRRPIVSYSPGTTGMADRCAISRTVTVPLSDPVTSYEAPFIAMLLAKGWAVAVTDYQGLGTPGNHPYVVGNVLGRNALDVVRAAQRLPVAGLSPQAPVLIWGYSEGGNGAGWAAQLASTYAPELHVRAAAFGGVPNDLPAMVPTIQNGPVAGLIAMAAIGFDTAYPGLRLNSYLNSRGKRYIPAIAGSCLDEGLAIGAFQHTSWFTTSDPLQSAAWKARLAQNKLASRRPPSFPIFLYHGTLDEAVAFRQDAALRTTWCARGAVITWRAVVGEHLSAYIAEAPAAASFLATELAGRHVATNC
jgi:hypothetical protein